MQRGSLIIYDNEGTIWLTIGDAEGDIPPHVYPSGLPYIETEYGELQGKELLKVDILSQPHKLVTKEIPQTALERMIELENQLLIAEGVI